MYKSKSTADTHFNGRNVFTQRCTVIKTAREETPRTNVIKWEYAAVHGLG